MTGMGETRRSPVVGRTAALDWVVTFDFAICLLQSGR